MLERRYKETDSPAVRAEIEKYMSVQPCPDCEGRRLRPEALAVKVARPVDRRAVVACRSPTCGRIVPTLALDERERTIADKVVQEIGDRLRFLDDVGVGYLTLDRSSATLSGGESQRIRLATQIGSKLMGVLYVLDEPSIGLHQRDNARLIATLQGMRDLGNSVLVVEHDEETIRAADWVIDLGPGAGVHGGEVVAAGHAGADRGRSADVAHRRVPARRARGAGAGRAARGRRPASSSIEGARHNNLRGPRRRVPARRLHRRHRRLGLGQERAWSTTSCTRRWRGTSTGARDGRASTTASPGLEQLDKVIAIDQSPIGRTPRSNPATYTNVFNHDPQPDGDDAGGAGARLRARALQLQRAGRALRGLRRRRADQDRDALPARHLRHLRGLRRQALRPRDPGGALQGAEHRRDPRPARSSRRASSSATSRRSSAILSTLDEVGPRLHPARPAGDDALGRRGAARQARHRALQALDRADPLPPRRADDRPPLRRRAASSSSSCTAWSTWATP